MDKSPPKSLLIIYGIAILSAFLILSNSDYADARMSECAAKSTSRHLVTWDKQADRCIKELRNGTTKKN